MAALLGAASLLCQDPPERREPKPQPLSQQPQDQPASQPWHRHSADPRFQGGFLFWFTLDETRAQLIDKLGVPVHISETGPDLEVWHFQFNVVDRHEYSHLISVRKKDFKIVSISRNYEVPEMVDALFPPKITETHYWMENGKRAFGARLRRLSNGRLLLAMGSDAPGKPASQILLIRQSELGVFMPWLEESLRAK